MGWAEIRAEALKNDELVYSFDQTVAARNFYAGKFDPAAKVEQGYCLGLAVQWCALRLQGKDYNYAPNRALSPSETYVAAHDHATFRKAFDEGKRSLRSFLDEDILAVDNAAYNLALAPYRLKAWGAPRVHKGAPDPGFLIGSGEQRGGVALLIWRGTGGAHATAVNFRSPAERVNYFDANYGHFQFASAGRFVNWCAGYCRETGYDKAFATVQAQHILGLL